MRQQYPENRLVYCFVPLSEDGDCLDRLENELVLEKRGCKISAFLISLIVHKTAL